MTKGRSNRGRRTLLAALAVTAALVLAGSSATGARSDGPSCSTAFLATCLDGIFVSNAAVVEGDSGTTPMTFDVERLNPSGTLTVPYQTTSDGTATPGTDFTPTSGTLTFTPGQTDQTITVPVIGDTTPEPTETVSLSVGPTTPEEPIVPDTEVTGSIYDDDGGLPFDVIAKTGDDGLTTINPDVSINDSGDVAFSGSFTNSSGGSGNGLFVKLAGKALQNIAPQFSNLQFENGGIDNSDEVVAWDQHAGSPPSDFVRRWFAAEPNCFSVLGGTASAPNDPNDVCQKTATNSVYSGLGSPTTSDSGAFAFFGYTYGAGTVVDDGLAQSQNVNIPHPVVDDNGDVLFRVVPDGTVTSNSIANAPINLYDQNFNLKANIACPTSQDCAQYSSTDRQGFTSLGEEPGLSGDGQVVAFYAGAYTPPQGLSVTGGPGIYASIDTASGRQLVAIAHVGDGGITAFEPDSRISVNSTQATQHSVTIVFLADNNDGKAIYTVNLGFKPQQSGTFDPMNPAGFTVGKPVKIVGVGQTIRGVGKVSDLAVDDAINDHESGDIAFWAQAGSTQAVVRVLAPQVPLLFVPGIAGSELHDLNGSSTANLWMGNQYLGSPCDIPHIPASSYKALSLKVGDRAGTDVVPSGLILCVGNETLESVYEKAGVYGPLINALEQNNLYTEYDLGQNGVNESGCDFGQESNHPNLFVFPYDWRMGNPYNAANLNAYMACIHAFYPQTQVNVLTHSMGGLLTRRTLLQYKAFADNVHALLTLMPPWLGAPKLPYVLMTGDFAGPIAVGPGPKYAAMSLPGAHDLFPSRSYFTRAPLPFGEEGFDLGTGQPAQGKQLYTYDQMVQYFDQLDPEFEPGTVGEVFHDYSDPDGPSPASTQDDASNDAFAFPFYEIYGVQKDWQTIGTALATTKALCVPDPNGTGLDNCDNNNYESLLFVQGDGTVPVASAARDGMQPANATIIPFYQANSVCCAADSFKFDHNGIIGNPELQQKVIQIFADNGGPKPPASADRVTRTSSSRRSLVSVADAADDPMRSIVVLGAGAATVADDAGNKTGSQPGPDPTNSATYTDVPDTQVYTLSADNDDVLVRSEASKTLTTTFASSGGPFEVDVSTDDDGTVTGTTEYSYGGLPAGTNVQLQTVAGEPPTLAYDSNGDGTYDTTINSTITVTGAAAADTTPPTVTDTVQRNADGTIGVTLTGADDGGAGFRAAYYSIDGTNYQQYPGAPVSIDPTQHPNLWFFGEDNAGNESTPVEVPLVEPAGQGPTAATLAAATDENAPVQVTLAGNSPRNVPLTYSVTDPTHGTVSLSGGTVTYTPVHDYYGTDTFTYTADDGLQASSAATVTVTVNHVNQPPDIVITAPATANEGGPISLSAAVTDPDGDAVTLGAWTTTVGTVVSNGANATLTVDDGPATATVGFTATDAHGAVGSGTAIVAVQNVAPTVTVKALTGTLYWGVQLPFSGLATDPSSADTLAGFGYVWNFGDGQTASGASTTHAYSRAGSFTPALSATDKDRGTGTASTPVTIRQRPSRLAYTGSTNAAYGFATLSATLSDAYSPSTAQLAGHRVIFSLGSVTYAAYTDSSGNATVVTSSPVPPGSYTVNVLFSADQLYGSSVARATLAVTSSTGTATGTGLVPATGGTATFSATSTGTSVSGTLSYASGSTTVQATLGTLGISSDGHEAWLSGVDSLHRTVALYVEDNGSSGDIFKLWLNGQLVTGTGTLTAGDVSVQG